jgi:transposase
MLHIDQVQDIEMLRQMAHLLDRENRRLHDRLVSLTEEIARLRGTDTTKLQTELDLLKELLANRNQELFGESSERRPRPAAAKDPATIVASNGHGPRPQPMLPIVEKIHELAEDERGCPACGGQLTEMKGQSEDSEEVSVVERKFVLVKHRRQKYRCRCNGHIETAPPPPRLAATEDARGHRYSPEFAVEVAIEKYQDHQPLQRQVGIMKREGLVVDSQTLWDQIEALAALHRGTYEALRHYVLSAEVVGADETWWRLMHNSGGSKRWWAWSVCRDDAIVHHILDNRSKEAAKEVLAGYQGVVMADGYGAYQALAGNGSQPGFRLVHCWAHVRRKFVEAEPHHATACAEILDLIGKLYEIDGKCPDIPAHGSLVERAEALAVRARLRNESSRPIVKSIYDWAIGQRTLPQGSLGGAIRYMLGMWSGLNAFLDDARIPLDNNHTERGLRAMVLGRKNHYGSRSQRGTEVAALFYSLIDSAKLAGVEPKAYLMRATQTVLSNRSAILLPKDLSPP